MISAIWKMQLGICTNLLNQPTLNPPLSGREATHPGPPLSGRETKEGFINMKRPYIPYNKKLVEIARINRKNPTQAENKIWHEILKDKQFEKYKFHRQKPLDNFIADFYCPELMLVIEIDGDSHDKQKEYDTLRSEKLSEYGMGVIRYSNDKILSDINSVHQDLKEKIKTRQNKSSPDKGRRGGVR